MAESASIQALKALLLRESDLDYLEASLRLWQAQMQEAADMVVFLSQHIDEVRKAAERDENCPADCPGPCVIGCDGDAYSNRHQFESL